MIVPKRIKINKFDRIVQFKDYEAISHLDHCFVHDHFCLRTE